MYNDIKEWHSIKGKHLRWHVNCIPLALTHVWQWSACLKPPSLYLTGYMHITHAWQRHADVIMATHTASHCLRRLSLL